MTNTLLLDSYTMCQLQLEQNELVHYWHLILYGYFC